MTISPTTPPLPLTEAELCGWLGSALPGERLVYHRGHLALDGSPSARRLGERERAALLRLAGRARGLAEQGLAHLVQERHGPDDYSYILVARPKPRARRALSAQVSVASVTGARS